MHGRPPGMAQLHLRAGLHVKQTGRRVTADGDWSGTASVAKLRALENGRMITTGMLRECGFATVGLSAALIASISIVMGCATPTNSPRPNSGRDACQSEYDDDEREN